MQNDINSPEGHEEIASTGYEACRAFARVVCNDSAWPSWAMAPIELKEEYRGNVRVLLENPLMPIAQIHEDWRQRKIREEGGSDHPWVAPFTELHRHQQVQYHIFKGVVEAFRLSAQAK